MLEKAMATPPIVSPIWCSPLLEIVDFCCGANDFNFLMKKKLDETGTRCSYKNYDVLQAKGEQKLVGSLQPASQCWKEHMIGFAIVLELLVGVDVQEAFMPVQSISESHCSAAAAVGWEFLSVGVFGLAVDLSVFPLKLLMVGWCGCVVCVGCLASDLLPGELLSAGVFGLAVGLRFELMSAAGLLFAAGQAANGGSMLLWLLEVAVGYPILGFDLLCLSGVRSLLAADVPAWAASAAGSVHSVVVESLVVE
ncbi:Protein ENHANCED DOWNY MILDEW 2 [Camellia lanceoleosa]|uniref:Protein ENHANCED DOWNY MILDEW 2 n=1 Tax=Camellia lanceoleosa TaxID=1840588 RepID=A0ACC0F6W6_9ERIC|nr:Protein ENHANCED DOWNY MILDEW 2 [Camellia lanceoleosa]